MTLSWSPHGFDPITPCPSASERRMCRISPTQLETVVTVHGPTRELGKAGTAGAISSRVSGG